MNDRRHVYTKSRLIKELAFRAGIKKVASRQILEVLAAIIKRETPNGPFILPGGQIIRLDGFAAVGEEGYRGMLAALFGEEHFDVAAFEIPSGRPVIFVFAE